MTAPLEIESEVLLQRLVREHDTVIARCFHGSDEVDSDLYDSLAAASSAVLCRIKLSTVAAAGLPLPDHVGGEGGEGEGDMEVVQEAWWLFFRGGETVYAARGPSTPAAKLCRLAALLERSPDTLGQLSRQDQVSRRQKREQDAAATAAATAVHGREEDGTSRLQHRGHDPSAAPGEGAHEEGGEGGADRPAAVLIFVAGDRSQVGKSSTCLGLLGALLRQQGLRAGDLAYIKPATQCEKPQLVTAWCEANGVACRGIGPVVFYKGFTREFLKGGAGTSEELLEEIKDAVGDISAGKKVVVVDGVGYPAVGSICGVSNGDVAAALGAPVLLVGKSGVGDAVDSYNLNACFFEARGVRVLGGVFNRISTTGYYSLERCREAVTSYFAQANPSALPYGFVPEIDSLKKPVVPAVAGAAVTAPAAPTTTAVPPAPSSPQPVLPGAAGAAAGSREEGVEGRAAAEAVPGLEGAGTAARATQQPLPVTGVEGEEDLQAFVASAGGGRLVLMDFWAEWCKNCKAILPFVHGLPERLHGAVAVATADVDEADELADARNVSTIPHFILLRNGVQVDSYTGSSETELLSRLTKHLASAGPPQTTPSTGDSGTTTAGSAGEAAAIGTGSNDKVAGGGQQAGGKPNGINPVALGAAEELIDAFEKNVDVARLLGDIREHAAAAAAARRSSGFNPSLPPPPLPLPLPSAGAANSGAGASSDRLQPSAAGAGFAQQGGNPSSVVPGHGGGRGSSLTPQAQAGNTPAKSSSRKSREEVEAEAAKLGASGG